MLNCLFPLEVFRQHTQVLRQSRKKSSKKVFLPLTQYVLSPIFVKIGSRKLEMIAFYIFTLYFLMFHFSINYGYGKWWPSCQTVKNPFKTNVSALGWGEKKSQLIISFKCPPANLDKAVRSQSTKKSGLVIKVYYSILVLQVIIKTKKVSVYTECYIVKNCLCNDRRDSKKMEDVHSRVQKCIYCLEEDGTLFNLYF